MNNGTMKIREFKGTDLEYEASVALWNANWPDYQETAGEWKNWHATRDSRYFFRRLVGEQYQQIVCYLEWGETSWSYQPGKYYWSAEIHPDIATTHNRESIYQYIVAEIQQRSPIKLVHSVRSDKTDRVAFVERKGYVEAEREQTSDLDVGQFDPSAFAPSVENARAQGIEIYSLAQLKDLDKNWKRKIYDLYVEVHADIPSADGTTPRSFESYSKNLDNPIVSFLDTRYVAVDGNTKGVDDVGAYVAMSNLEYNSVNPGLGHTGLTGVARTYRRRGIATALKVHAIVQAKADGVKRINTENEESNPMLDLNIRLGFKPGTAWITYEKKVV